MTPRALILASSLVLAACGASASDPAAGEAQPSPLGAADQPTPTTPDSPPSVSPPSVSPQPVPRGFVTVAGDQLVDERGAPVRMLGVNYSGAEYMCIQARGIFDGPADDALVGAIAAWKANVVRIGVNPHCWLGVANVDPRFGGKTYRDAVSAFVERFRARGIWVVLELHWSSSIPGNAKGQQPMLDREHGLPFWKSVATTFGADRGVLFDLYNEPFLDTTNTNHAFNDDVWECWRLGCTVQHEGETYVAAGMQPLVDEVRGTGAKNVLLLGGLAYANDLRGFASHLPNDSARALVASAHIYANTRCNDESCWTAEIGDVAATTPVITGELGQADCARAFVERYMAWADPRGIGYLGWTFNVGDCATRPSLITDWAGTPSAFGAAFKERFAAPGS